MKHIKIGGLRHTMQQWHGSMLVVAQQKCGGTFATKTQKAKTHHTTDALRGAIVGVVKFE